MCWQALKESPTLHFLISRSPVPSIDRVARTRTPQLRCDFFKSACQKRESLYKEFKGFNTGQKSGIVSLTRVTRLLNAKEKKNKKNNPLLSGRAGLQLERLFLFGLGCLVGVKVLMRDY